ncbi:ribonuclease H-like domain-containing protein [Paenibacillus abyssi]|uniref:YprB ribonuclease H-like domain-containing protein n=1 Tax=Paenibacillus abyssi TaxID=1340531 RepID=A0A917CKX6_9BACL|nr:ribonuclease H-like domain-containing protein [Paenibacillus abyssi]GGF89849.1 hypothetical protein GCM10010916_03970 [Paenibacillus abyssi]
MSGLRERMNRLRGASPQSSAAEDEAENRPLQDSDRLKPSEEEPEDRLSGEWSRMQVRTAANDWGSFLLREVFYPLDYQHGTHRLMELIDASAALSAFHRGSEETPAPSAYNMLFLDLETTGLGVGTGNVPFMVGLGYATFDRFVIEQSLIRHPAEERAMLAYLAEKLKNFDYLVTYNGRTFDWPVLAGRYIMNGLGRLDSRLLHLDFLHPSRSIWRNTLTSCKLSHIEEERLNIKRHDDVPGSLAPSIYFQYLADGDPAPLEGVFRHNEIDMLSLACLAIRFAHLLGGRLGIDVPYPEDQEELLRTGLWLDKMGLTDLAETLFARLADKDVPTGSWCLPLAARDKKVGNWERAVLLWQKIALSAEASALPSYEAHIELAMYNEHRSKDLPSALRYAESAMQLALRRPQSRRNDPKLRAELEAIANRLERLRRKQNKGNVN